MSEQLTGIPHVHPCLSPDSSVTAPCRLSALLVGLQKLDVCKCCHNGNQNSLESTSAGQGASMASSTVIAIQTWQLQERDTRSAAAYVVAKQQLQATKRRQTRLHSI